MVRFIFTCLFSFGISILYLASCTKSQTENLTNIGQNYAPLQIGRTLTYDVDSIIYDPQPNKSVKMDTQRWQIREVVRDTFRDNTTLLTYRIEIAQRKHSTSAWQIAKIVTEAINSEQLLRGEDNLRYIKLPLAFIEKTTWNGHIFNNENTIFNIADETLLPFSKKWTHRIETLQKDEKIGNKTYEEVLTIIGQTDPKSLIEKRYVIEKYAKNKGLIYREWHILDTQKTDATIAWEKRAEKGVIVIQRIIE
jgi:hypothetical protein